MKDAEQILVTRSSMPDLDEYVDEIRSLWDTHWLTNMGVKHQKFQKELERYLQVEHIELMVNGHMALELAMQALELKGEVITTPFTFASTTHAIVRNGLIPVFCDIEPENYTIDVSKIEDLITDKTCAIVPVHVYGNICNVEEIDRIAKKYDLKVIYDAAHTFGETYNGVGVGNFGDVSIFSFHATKVFNTIEGGAVAYKDLKIGDKLYDLKDFGIHGPESVTGIGANAKMNEFSAAMGICNLRHIDDEIEKRKKAFERYYDNLGDIKGLHLLKEQPGVKHNYSYFPVAFDEDVLGYGRDKIYDDLAKYRIYARKYFYPLTNEFDCYKGRFDQKTPIAHKISRSILALPIYADIEPEIVDKICGLIKK